MHSNTTKQNKTKHDFRFQWGWVSCIRYEKFGRDLHAVIVQPILHRVTCSNEMVPDAPKHYETQQKMSLGSKAVDQVHSLQKLPTQVRGTIFLINWTISAHFALSLLPSKQFQMHPNTKKCNKTEFRFQCGGLGAFVVETSDVTL